jgi:hypothetical protein
VSNEQGLKLIQLSMKLHFNIQLSSYPTVNKYQFRTVSYPEKGGCADPVNEDAILEGVGGRPPGRSRKRQLASDTGDGKT